MNKDEMIKDMAMILAQADRECLTKSDDCGVCNAWGKEPCASYNEAEALYNAGCRILTDGEIIVVPSEHDTITMFYERWQEADRQLHTARQETAREIFEELGKQGKVNWVEEFVIHNDDFCSVAKKHGIKLELE